MGISYSENVIQLVNNVQWNFVRQDFKIFNLINDFFYVYFGFCNI